MHLNSSRHVRCGFASPARNASLLLLFHLLPSLSSHQNTHSLVTPFQKQTVESNPSANPPPYGPFSSQTTPTRDRTLPLASRGTPVSIALFPLSGIAPHPSRPSHDETCPLGRQHYCRLGLGRGFGRRPASRVDSRGRQCRQHSQCPHRALRDHLPRRGSPGVLHPSLLQWSGSHLFDGKVRHVACGTNQRVGWTRHGVHGPSPPVRCGGEGLDPSS